MAEIEATVFLAAPGSWKNFDELEEFLTLGELLLLLSRKRELTAQEHEFLAALQGIPLGENKPGEFNPDNDDIIEDPDALGLFGYTEE